MEITGIEKVRTVTQVIKKEAIAPAKIEDTLSISSEAQKKAEWVEKLKQMPEIRADKLAGVVSKDPLHHPAILTDLARKLQSLL